MSTTGEYVPGNRLWWWPRRRSVVLDAVLAAISAVECLIEGVYFAERTGVSVGVTSLFGLLVGAALLFRRRWPVAVVLLSIAVTPAQMGVLLGMVGLYTLAASDVPRRITAVLVGMSVAGTLIATFLKTGQGYDGSLAATVVTSVLAAVGVNAPPVLLGMYVGARRRLVESLRERADGLERELSLLAEKASERAERARMEERTRIAREMHDVVAHRVSLMVVHAAALEAVALKDPQKAAVNAGMLGDMGRQALNELRQMLGVLRTPPVSTPVPVSAPLLALGDGGGVDGDDDGPCLEELEVLVEESRAVGMSVDFTVEGAKRPVAALVQTTVYRVVQEALTNVHKHAPGAKAQVRLAYREDEVAVLVLNGPPDGGSDVRLPSGGNGLLGMRERVTALGGGFAAGATGEGGFRVSALVPARAG
ncbi:histidine kinase [Streptomyces sp. NBC_01537]|uniref:sensor histidine kinase n=1 Tax=Streptomyces sp. NBC_01537 TaxID=2903896 RepID=UPI00387085D3